MLGSDPEVFLVDARGRAVSAHLMYPRLSKTNRRRCGWRGEISRDGFVVEVNPVASECRETLANNTLRILHEVKVAAKQRGLRLQLKSALRVGPAQLRKAPLDAMTFGCDQSWNAYTNEPCLIDIEDPIKHGWRYAGGHMHISPVSPRDHGAVVRAADATVGIVMSWLFDNEPGQFIRRRYYGQAGDYRPQKYRAKAYNAAGLWGNYGGAIHGVEYRTPGPEMWRNSIYVSLAYGLLRDFAVAKHRQINTSVRGRENEIQKAINTGVGLDRLLKTVEPIFHKFAPMSALQLLKAKPTTRYRRGLYGWDWFCRKNGVNNFYEEDEI